MIIPFNMRDGILICKGKSNEDWNYFALHGGLKSIVKDSGKRYDRYARFYRFYERYLLKQYL